VGGESTAQHRSWNELGAVSKPDHSFEQWVYLSEDCCFSVELDSTDHGVNWNGNNCLACSSENNEGWPDITVDPSYGDFHATYRFIDGVDIFNSMYSHAAQNTPWSWSEPQVVNDVPYAYNDWPRPVSGDWASGGAGVAWLDWRTATQAVFFDIMPDGT